MKNSAQKNISTIICLLFIALFLLFPSLVIKGHGSGGSFEITENGYTIDIGYDAETIEANSSIRFDFNILEEKTLIQKSFQSLWVRFETQDGEPRTIFASGIHNPSIGLPTMLFTFPIAGKYSLYTRFEDSNNEKITEVTIPFFVEKETTSSLNWTIMIPFLTAIFGILFGFFLSKKFSTK